MEPEGIEAFCRDKFFPVGSGNPVSMDSERLNPVFVGEVLDELSFIGVQEVVAILGLDLRLEFLTLGIKYVPKAPLVEELHSGPSFSPLPLDLGHFPHQVAHFVAIEFGNRGNAMNVLDEVFRCAQERLERRLTVAATEQ